MFKNALSSLTNFEANEVTRIGNCVNLELNWKKFVKALQDNLFLAVYSYLEPLCAGSISSPPKKSLCAKKVASRR